MTDQVAIGKTVTWYEEPLGRTFTRRIVLPVEVKADQLAKVMPANAPIAQAIMGKVAGAVVVVETPYATKTITIREVK